MTTTATLPAVERQLVVRASPARVWRALTDPKELVKWFGQHAELDLRPGGDAWMEFDGYGHFAMRVEAVDPERFLSIRWASEPGVGIDAGPTTLLEWTLTPTKNGGTQLHLRESGFTDQASRFNNIDGWVHELGELMDHLATQPWEHPLRRTMHFTASPERVWRAFGDPVEFKAWWGAKNTVELQPGWEGWFDFPIHGRHAVRIETVEPPRYLAWRWVADKADVPLAEADQVLLTEWLVQPRDDGGTDLQLVESGYQGPESRMDNDGGWDTEVLPGLERLING